jgi:hypothetical protein
MSISFVFAISGTFTVSAPNVCGDGVIGNNEECDVNDFNNSTCLTMGYSSGIISCTSECTFDESSCVLAEVDGGISGDGSDLVRECNDGIDNDSDGRIDFPDDSGCSNFLDNSEDETTCDSEWQEDDWGACIEEIKVRRIIDVNHCKSDYIQNETSACFVFDEEFVEDNYISLLTLSLIVLAFIILVIAYYRSRMRKRK